MISLVDILVLLTLMFVVFRFFPIGTYLSAKVASVKISFREITQMQNEKIPISSLLEFHNILSMNGFYVDFHVLLKCYKAGVNLDNVVNGIVKSLEHNLDISFDKACIADLQNIDIEKTVINAIAHVEKKG